MDTRATTPESRYLKTPDGTVYGPVDPVTLCAWSAEARVTPGCLVSRDGETWRDAAEVPELRLHWQTTLADGTVVGPLNLFALWELIQDGSLPRGLILRNRLTGAETALDERLLPVALQEARATLDAMAAQMAAGVAQASASTEREALQERLAQAEKELANNVRLMGESQKLLVAREQQMKALEARLVESQASLSADRRDFEAKLADMARERDSDSDKGSAEGQEQQDELSRVRAEADRLRIAHERAAADWAAERAVLAERLAEAVAEADRRWQSAEAGEAKCAGLTVRLETVQREAQTQVAGMTARVEALRQASDVLKADGEIRLAEARQAVETAEARGAAERQALEARVGEVLRECEALKSVRDELRATLAVAAEARDVAVAERAAAGRLIRETEARLDQAIGERDAERRRSGELEQAVRDLTGREETLRRDMAAAAADWAARNEAHEQTAALLRRSAGETEAASTAEREELRRRISGLEQQITEAERAVVERDARLAEAAKQRETILEEVSRNQNTHLERAEQRKREVEQTARSLGDIRAELAAAQQALTTERERSAATETRLTVEMKGLQRDLHALAMVKTAARKLRDEHAAAGPMIDWLSGGSAAASTAGGAEKPADKFAGLDLPQQVDLLHEELRLSVEDKERLRRDLEKVRADYGELERRSEANGLELGATVTRLQNELQSNASMVQQTMKELERRESAGRQSRKKVEEREKELQDRINALESERARTAQEAPVIIEGEWETPRPETAPPPRDEPPSDHDGQGERSSAVLNTVEAQLRVELEKWHSLAQGKNETKEKPQQWFRWKKS